MINPHDLLDDVTVSYKGKSYQYLGQVQMKCPETGDWKEAVHYFDGMTSSSYVREKEDFLAKFTLGDSE